MRDEQNANWERGEPIGYIRKEIPDFAVSAYEGERYEAWAPDTLDLQERAALAVNVLTRATDPLADYEMYFDVFFKSKPPLMEHNFSDSCQSKFMEALPLMRIISGSDLNAEVDRRWMEVALHQLGPDGLAYAPNWGRPWTYVRSHFIPEGSQTETGHQIIPFYCGRLLSAMMVYHRRDGSSLWREAAERLVDGLAEVAVDRGRYAYYAPSSHWVEKGSTYDYGREHPLMGAHVSFVALGLAHVYRETGYEPAITLAEKLIRYIVEEIHYIETDGRFGSDRPTASAQAHFHMHTYSLLAILEFERVTGDTSWLELVQSSFEYGMAHGNGLLGYFPELLRNDALQTSELCEVADMIALGLKLSEGKVGDYWDDVDRWVRNMFAEGQLRRIDWIERVASDLPPAQIDETCQTTERVAERNLGAFASWPKANDWYDADHFYGRGIMHCCTGNGTRAIYYIWEHILSHDAGKLKVNLLLNRASPWADVDSHIPYVGQVDVKVKQEVDLAMRIPEWVTPEQVRVGVGDVDRRVDWDGRYAGVGAVRPGDVVTMTFPMADRTDTVSIEKEEYRLTRKGNEVVAIDPPGRYCPLYLRDHYRENSTRWRKIERFVSDEQIYW